MFALLVLLASSALPIQTRSLCVDCTWDAGRAKLCSPHRSEERDVLSAAARSWKAAKTAGERVEILEAVAELTASHANAPSPKVAEFLLQGIESLTSDVYGAALTMLLDGQHPGTVVDGLAKETKSMQRYWKGIVKAIDDRKFGRAWISWRQRSISVLTALGQLPSEDAWKAVERVLDWNPKSAPARLQIVAMAAALELGSADSVAAAAEALDRVRKAVKKDKTGPFYKSSYTSFASAAIEMLSGAIDVDVEQMEGLLEDFAKKKGLPPATSGTSWSSWAKKNAAAFDELPRKLTQPINAKLIEPPPELNQEFGPRNR